MSGFGQKCRVREGFSRRGQVVSRLHERGLAVSQRWMEGLAKWEPFKDIERFFEEEKETEKRSTFARRSRGVRLSELKLPACVKQDRAEAQFKNGTSKILRPKLKEEKTGRIKVKVP